MKELLVGLIIIVSGLYLLFCMFLGTISLPDNTNPNQRFMFTEEPSSFVKTSRLIGIFAMSMFCIAIVLAFSYEFGKELLH